MVVTGTPPNSPEPSDSAATLAALRRGDAAAFRELVNALNPGLTRLAQTYVTPALADEVVQETWAAVITSLDTFEERSSLKTWIYRILLNKVRTLAGRESKIVPFAALGPNAEQSTPSVDPHRLEHPIFGPGHWRDIPAPWHDLPPQRLESEEALAMINDAIDALPPAQREVVVLRDVVGRPANEISEALGITSVNQRVLLHRGRAAIRAMLEEYLAE